MTEILREKNKNVKFIDINSEEFREYGEVITDFDANPFIEAAKKIEMPESGAKYVPSSDVLESLEESAELKERFFGQLPAQVGYCWGYNTKLDCTEWHTSSEINIATTDVILLLAKRCQIKDNKIDSSKFVGVFVPKGTVIETYATTLHFTPCEANKDGFGWVVVLPDGTNTNLDCKTANPLLWAKNKWLISHVENKTVLDKGAVGGILGENFDIKY